MFGGGVDVSVLRFEHAQTKHANNVRLHNFISRCFGYLIIRIAILRIYRIKYQYPHAYHLGLPVNTGRDRLQSLKINVSFATNIL